MGLSPRVRGSRYHAVRWRPTGGSIPACAGKPSWLRTLTPCVGVYPRVCGEAVRPPFEQLGTKGLSPRVRGSRRAGAARGPHEGSIPACAGKPIRRATISAPSRVYPRVCGEAIPISKERAQAYGLSPRVRGSPDQVTRFPRILGSIPACAGKPARGLLWKLIKRVYPRVCGEAGSTRNLSGHWKGLSPRVRGSRSSGGLPGTENGSIPACAGKPTEAFTLTSHDGVYPRVCGEAVTGAVTTSRMLGLSPRVRGSPCQIFDKGAALFSIQVLHRFEYSDLSASSEEACRHRLRAGGLEKVNRVRRQGLQSGTPTGA